MNQYTKQFRVDKININLFKNIETEYDAYWLGFLYADGNVSNKENKIELSLSMCDYSHIEKFKKYVGLNNKICFREKQQAYRFSFRSYEIKDNLINNGCIPKKSLILQFPDKNQVPDELLRHFMRGYFDGDGCFCNTNCCFEASFLGTEDFINGFLKRGPDIFTKSNYGIYNGSASKKIKKYSVYRHNIKEFLNYLYKDANIYLDRKYEHYQNFLLNGAQVYNKFAVQ